jgi:stage II sporulation protein D
MVLFVDWRGTNASYLHPVKAIAITAILLVISSISSICLSAPPPKVRVLVESGKAITIDGGRERIGILPVGEKPGSEIVVGTTAVVSAGKDGLLVDRIPAGKSIVLKNVSRYYSIGYRKFRGKIEIKWKSPEEVIVVNHVPLEKYLSGLLGSEMYPNWPIEALKAQAVAARTYALHHSDVSRNFNSMKDYDVTSTVHSQVYEGAHKEGFRAKEACRQTEGMALLRGGNIFPTYYHSCCGGVTEHAHNVWPGERGPRQIKDPYCLRSPKRKWTYSLHRDTLANKLSANGFTVGTISKIGVEVEEDSPRNRRLLMMDETGGKAIAATELRRILGYSNLKSTWFEVDLKGSEITFRGKGYGHGVGMCQWGAKGMADEGFSYEAILKHYYPDAELARMY